MKFSARSLFVLVFVLSVEKFSHGDFITYTDSITNNLPNTLTGTVGSTSAASITQFSSSLGTLNSITIQQKNYVTVDAVSQVIAGEFIQGNNITSWTWATVAAFALNVPGGTDPGVGVSFSSYGSYDSPISPESAEVYFSTTINGNVIPVNSNSFSSYIGNGNVTVNLETAISTQIQPLPATLAGFTWLLLSQNLGGGIVMNDTDILTVTYGYTPYSVVPEPSSHNYVPVGRNGVYGIFRLSKTLSPPECLS